MAYEPTLAQDSAAVDQGGRAVAEIGEWLRDKLSDYGSFRVTAVFPQAEFRLEITEVSVVDCELRYTQQTRAGMMGMPSNAKVALPLASLDTTNIIDEPLDLGRGVRLEGQPGQVFVLADRRAPPFVYELDRQEVTDRSVYIPVDSRRHAREIAGKLREAARICSNMQHP
jgi:hypothetical protein